MEPSTYICMKQSQSETGGSLFPPVVLCISLFSSLPSLKLVAKKGRRFLLLNSFTFWPKSPKPTCPRFPLLFIVPLLTISLPRSLCRSPPAKNSLPPASYFSFPTYKSYRPLQRPPKLVPIFDRLSYRNPP